jgi:glycine cleavage system aminomethyltransferase T
MNEQRSGLMTGQADSATLYFGPWYRKSPYFEATRRAGCTGYDIYSHMYLPGFYDDPVKEYWHLLNAVTIWDVGVERQVEITGPDAFAFTDMLTPRDLTKCAVGQCKYVLLTDQDGGILNDPVLLRLGENHFWLSAADADILLWAKGIAIHAGMDVEIREPDASPLQIQGPRSREVVTALFGEEVASLRYYHCAEADLEGIPVVVSRTGWTGEVGYEVYLRDGRRGEDLWERVMDAGRPFDIRPIAPCEARRIEAGIFNYGSDMTEENNPFEVTGLERLVEFDGSAFVGRDALERIGREGVSRKLVGVEIGGEPLPAENAEPWPVLVSGSEAGRVTAAIHSPRLGTNIGYAWVPIEQAPNGTEVTVEAPAGTLSARVTALPFWDPKKETPKA